MRSAPIIRSVSQRRAVMKIRLIFALAGCLAGALPAIARADSYETRLECNGVVVSAMQSTVAESVTLALALAKEKGANLGTCFLSGPVLVNGSQRIESPTRQITADSDWGAVSVASKGYKPAAYARQWQRRTQDKAMQEAQKTCRQHASPDHKSSCATIAYRGGWIAAIRCKNKETDLAGEIGFGNGISASEAFDLALQTAAAKRSPGYCEVRALFPASYPPPEIEKE